MTKQVEHPASATGPADFALALAIAGGLHTPTPRAPEVAAARLGAGRRGTSARARRRTVRG
ncbi:hypothetical protein [Streptomyces viridochromogenes]|nr:hypothetical protein [Streptomyces viridochromogenes]